MSEVKNTSVEAVKQMTQIIDAMKEGKNAEEIKVAMKMTKSQYHNRLRSMRQLGVSWVVSKSRYNLISNGVFK